MMKESISTRKEIEIGAIFYENGRRPCHVVNLFNDKRKAIVAYKYWYRHRKEWCYEAIERSKLEGWLSCEEYNVYTWIKIN